MAFSRPMALKEAMGSEEGDVVAWDARAECPSRGGKAGWCPDAGLLANVVPMVLVRVQEPAGPDRRFPGTPGKQRFGEREDLG